MKLRDLPDNEKPYEKIENYGVENLSNAELLAVIIKTGTKNYTAIEIAQKILLLDYDEQGLSFLKNVTLEELRTIEGMGRVKALQIKAVAEFCSRFSKPSSIVKFVIKSPKDAAELLMPEMKAEKQEIIKTVIMNNQNKVIRVVTNALGNSNSSYVEIKDIFREVVKSGAMRIIIAHNHPSGSLKPSVDDIKFTLKVQEAGMLLGVEVLDHLIISNEGFVSMKQLGKL